MRFGLIEKKAALVLEAYKSRLGGKANFPPIPVEPIATTYYGFGIGREEFDGEISGKLFLKSKVILLNSTDPSVRQRFSIAHELGHIEIHTDKISREIIVSQKGDTGRLETEANAFAAALLMPKRLIYEYLIKETVGTEEDPAWLLDIMAQLSDSELSSINRLLFSAAFEDDGCEPGRIDLLPSSIREIAKIFQVSKEALSWRLKSLGLLHKLFS